MGPRLSTTGRSGAGAACNKKLANQALSSDDPKRPGYAVITSPATCQRREGRRNNPEWHSANALCPQISVAIYSAFFGEEYERARLIRDFEQKVALDRVFIATKIDRSLKNLSMGEALIVKQTLLGDLPSLIQRTGEIAAGLPVDDPLVKTAQWAAGLGSSIGGGTSIPPEASARFLTAQEAFVTVGSGAYFGACRAVPLIQMLKTYGLASELQSEMTEQVRRIVKEAERLGAVKPVSIAKAARLQIATANIALEHALGLSRNATEEKGHGPIREHRVATGSPLRTRRWKRGVG